MLMLQPQTDLLLKVSRPPVVYPKRVRLFEPGHANRLFCVVSGMVHAYTVNEYGDRRHVEFYGPGEFFGGVTQGDQCFVAESLEKECVVHSWEPYECERVREDGRLQEWWWKRSLWHQGLLQHRHIRGRVPEILIDLGVRFGVESLVGRSIDLPYLTHERLACSFSTRREIASAVMGELRKCGSLTYRIQKKTSLAGELRSKVLELKKYQEAAA